MTEPEAAAAYCLHSSPNNLKEGDSFIICDAGGGTVDLVSYQIEQINPLRISECVSGTGKLCGSVYLDKGFQDHIRKRIGNDSIDNMTVKAKEEMMRTWEDKVKFPFKEDSDEDDDYEVNVRGVDDNEQMCVEGGFHKMNHDEIKNIFDPIINDIYGLVDAQADHVRENGQELTVITHSQITRE